jgi:hypothetical protein
MVMNMDKMNINYHFTCPAAPVQAEGTAFGHRFYFRARFEYWTFSLSEREEIDPVEIQSKEGWEGCGFFREEEYGSEPFAASWMSHEEAEAIIRRCVEEYAKERGI